VGKFLAEEIVAQAFRRGLEVSGHDEGGGACGNQGALVVHEAHLGGGHPAAQAGDLGRGDEVLPDALSQEVDAQVDGAHLGEAAHHLQGAVVGMPLRNAHHDGQARHRIEHRRDDPAVQPPVGVAADQLRLHRDAGPHVARPHGHHLQAEHLVEADAVFEEIDQGGFEARLFLRRAWCGDWCWHGCKSG
jgi:hypothetical protein